MYRPFTRQWAYFNRTFNDCVYQLPRIFPNGSAENLIISVTGRGSTKGFSVFMASILPDLELISKGQCFPLYVYEKQESMPRDGLFNSGGDRDSSISEYRRSDGICDAGLSKFRKAYPKKPLSKENLFYYIYGILHSNEYRSRFADNLTKELPRIPAVKTYSGFQAFSQAGAGRPGTREAAHRL